MLGVDEIIELMKKQANAASVATIRDWHGMYYVEVAFENEMERFFNPGLYKINPRTKDVTPASMDDIGVENMRSLFGTKPLYERG